MMTSSNGNIFRVTGPLCGENTGHRWIPLTKASDAELWCFLWSPPEQSVEYTTEMPVIWDAIRPILSHCKYNDQNHEYTCTCLMTVLGKHWPWFLSFGKFLKLLYIYEVFMSARCYQQLSCNLLISECLSHFSSGVKSHARCTWNVFSHWPRPSLNYDNTSR